MHWLHGVPPGSSAQVPASTAMPQWPLLQVSPTQHGEAVGQLDPGGRQLEPAPQTSLVQAALQQSLGWVHAKPSGVHAAGPQTPAGLQRAAQHWLSVMHP
jgi:hypothetical protein